MILVELHAFESRTTSNKLMGKFGLIAIASTPVDLLVRVLSFVY